MKNNPFFSIIIPCYNVEKYIENTIFSVLNQNFTHFEIIAINDGSNDKTGEILENLSKQYNNISVYHQKNKGVSKARNLGIEKSKGKYIYFLDGDDFIESTLLLKAKEKLENNIQMYSFGYKVIKKNKEKKYLNNALKNNIFTSNIFLKKFLTYEISQSICSFIIEKKYLNNLKFDSSLRIGEDLDFQLQVLINNNLNIYYDSYPYFHYLQREYSSIKKKIILSDFNSIIKLNNYKNYFSINNLEKEFSYYIERRIIHFMKLIILNGSSKKDTYLLKNLIKTEKDNLKYNKKNSFEFFLFKIIFTIFYLLK